MDYFSDSMAWLGKPDGSVVIGYGPFESSVEPPAGGVAFHVQDFALQDPEPWKIPSRVERSTPAELGAMNRATRPPEWVWDPLDAAPFSVVFQEVMSSIHSGIFEKTVPVVTERGTSAEAPGPGIIEGMIRQPSPLHSYGWVRGSSGFAGATPELLFSLNGDRLETMALAGTARSEDRHVFAADEKEIREHEYVAQTLASKLLDLGKIQRRSREILDLGSIVHFLTTISLDLEIPQTPAKLLRRLHPTPALGPLPRTVETLALLLDWRERLGCPAEFGAPFGLWDHDRFDAIVAIRGIWWEHRQLMLPAGCGIIEASRLVNEWRELRLKRESVKNFIL
ncbi:chorismate-binding protein [Luteolibacter yonseiensis]|uniref:Chorismate-binding protein n=1 Tax=Luteolibacter yonseiensis TaxID=1144680 RepID=A0A934R8D7_9BACT|nr:chorismate-binding protein [Luteolibacter yonseiensis]MBK1817798.1 chorismate-binding protein [Luteolibacter yonseiensis]